MARTAFRHTAGKWTRMWTLRSLPLNGRTGLIILLLYQESQYFSLVLKRTLRYCLHFITDEIKAEKLSYLTYIT